MIKLSTKTVYEVYVGNIGRVHTGHSMKMARIAFCAYKNLSMSNRSRCSGEPVVLMQDGEPVPAYDYQPGGRRYTRPDRDL